MLLSICLVFLIQNAEAALDAETVKLLKQYELEYESERPPLSGIDPLMPSLKSRINQQQLSTVERYAATKEAALARWVYIRLLIECDRYESAAQLIVLDLSTDEGNELTRLWKWWEYSFGRRLDYREMSKSLLDGLLIQFDKGTPTQKQLIAKLLSKGKDEAKLSLTDFKKAINYDKMKERNDLTVNQVNYLQAADRLKQATPSKRLRFYLDYLSDQDDGIRMDAHIRLYEADPLDIIKMIRESNSSTIRQKLPRAGPNDLEEKDLYAFLTAALKSKDNIAVFLSVLKITDNKDDLGSLKDMAMREFIRIDPKGAINYLSAHIDSTNDLWEGLRYLKALRKLKFTQNISETRLNELLLRLLNQVNIAGDVIDDLRKWKYWQFTDAILSLTKRERQLALANSSILRFMVACPHALYPQAKAYAEKVQKEEPGFYKEVVEKGKLEEDK